jgi:Putative prokaryotic signal transducing protein
MATHRFLATSLNRYDGMPFAMKGDRWSAPTRAAQTAIISAQVGREITIGTFGTRDEAEIVQGLLASAGIDASIRADDAGGAFPFVLSGGAQVLVDESDAAAASELLANRTDET